jgi:hypothetical protein
VWLVIGLTALNVGATLLECGFSAYADNPVVHELLKRGALAETVLHDGKVIVDPTTTAALQFWSRRGNGTD